MQYRSKLSLLILSIFVVTNAQATSIQRTKIETQSDDISIPIAQSNLDEEISMEQAQRARREQPTAAMEISASSYQPSNLQTTSRIENATSFGSAGLPQLSVNGLSPLARNWDMKLGASFLGLNREGQVGAAGQTGTVQQTAYLISARAGAEYVPPTLTTKNLRPYATAAILPTLVMTGRSAFDDGSSQFGVPVEIGAGTLVHILTSLDLDLAVTGTLGRIQASNMNGLGVNAGVRFPL